MVESAERAFTFGQVGVHTQLLGVGPCYGPNMETPDYGKKKT